MEEIIKRIQHAVCIVLLIFPSFVYADEDPPPIGNFILPDAQQPGPLISFGENILPKGQGQLFLVSDYFNGVGFHGTDIAPGFIYGITDSLSILLSAPIANYSQNQTHSAGFEDSTIQLEYAVYQHNTAKYTQEITLLGGLFAPTGSAQKQPATGYGSFSFFLGATFNMTFVDWIFIGSPGVLLTTNYADGTRYGNEYLYDVGVGRNIFNIEKKWTIAGFLELDGIAIGKNLVAERENPNSGGNIVYLTPSVSVSSAKFIAQLGVGVPIIQKLNGQQNSTNYLVTMNLQWVVDN